MRDGSLPKSFVEFVRIVLDVYYQVVLSRPGWVLLLVAWLWREYNSVVNLYVTRNAWMHATASASTKAVVSTLHAFQKLRRTSAKNKQLC